MPSFLIKSFKGGLSDFEDKGIEGAFKFAKNIDIRKLKDSLSAGQALADDLASGTMTAIAVAIVPASDGNTYFFCRDGKIYRRNSGGTYSLVYTETTGDITGACEWYNNVGDTFLYWTCKNGSSASDLNRKRILGTGYTNAEPWSDVNATVNSQTYPKTNLTYSEYHTMRQVNGTLLGVNYNTLFLVGYDDSYTNNALQLIPGNIAKTLIERGLYAVTGTGRKDNREQACLFAWDPATSLSWNTKTLIPGKAVNALIDTEVPLMQVGTDGQLFYADTENVLPITSFPGGGQVAPEGVDVDSGMALFGVYGNGSGKTGIYSYGRKRKNADFVLNLEYQFDCDEIGAVKKVGSDILFSYKNGSAYGVKKVDTASKAVGTYQSLDLVAPEIARESEKEAEWTKAVLFFAPLPSGTSIEVWRKINKTGDFVRANLEGGATSYGTAGGQKAVFLIGDIGEILELQIVVNSYGNNSPEVYRARVYFK